MNKQSINSKSTHHRL